MNKILRIFVMLATLAIYGCATGYHSADNLILGSSGGYWDKKGPGRLIKVGFEGNGLVSKEKAGIYLLYRCAEVAKREGSQYFIFYQNLPFAISDQRSTEQVVAKTGGRVTSYAYILLTNEPGPSVLSSAEVIARLSPQVKSKGGWFR